MDYKGLRWFKCDLHVHTPASECFGDKTVTAEQWVSAAKNAGLDCVAVTDHNTGAWIDDIMTEAAKQQLIVFPGVEVTCDTSKIHVLVLFDRGKKRTDIEDFLIRLNIDRAEFGKKTAHTNFSALDVAKKADEVHAIVIPAHVDEFNGLGYCGSPAGVGDVYALNNVNAVQIVQGVWFENKSYTNEELRQYYIEHYQKRENEFSIDDVKNASRGVRLARDKHLKLLTFSDNPEAEGSGNHGLWGIGRVYSWIKMDEEPSLESLRQAFIIDDRTYCYFQSPNIPYEVPGLWINKIVVNGTTLNPRSPFVVDFNPQLTTIIGGRGSGKSSILRFLRGVLHNNGDLQDHAEIKKDQEDFFKLIDNQKSGVLTKNTVIDVYFERNKIKYRIAFKYVDNRETRTVEKFDETVQDYVNYEREGLLDFFEVEQYSQKQIYAIAQEPNALLKRLDASSEDILNLEREVEQCSNGYYQVMASIRACDVIISNKGCVETQIEELNNSINLLTQGKVAEKIKQQQSYARQKDAVFIHHENNDSLLLSMTDFSKLFAGFEKFDESCVDEKYQESLRSIYEEYDSEIESVREFLREKVERLSSLSKAARDAVLSSELISDANQFNSEFEMQKNELENRGVRDFSNFELYTSKLEKARSSFAKILEKEDELTELRGKKDCYFNDILLKRREISKKRKNLITKLNSAETKIELTPFKNGKDFEARFRRIIQKPSKYDEGIRKLVLLLTGSGDAEENLRKIKKIIRDIHDSIENADTDAFDGIFKNMIKALDPVQLDSVDLLYPEDDVIMSLLRGGIMSPISTASAGQKTTAILSFILLVGDKPLILDQPEDDLDNRLVCKLIVEKIKEIKTKRQVIVVTHNANIPVNGDAEYVVSMDCSADLKPNILGTVDKDDVKKEICEIMEGGKEAFRIRANRYNVL